MILSTHLVYLGQQPGRAWWASPSWKIPPPPPLKKISYLYVRILVFIYPAYMSNACGLVALDLMS